MTGPEFPGPYDERDSAERALNGRNPQKHRGCPESLTSRGKRLPFPRCLEWDGENGRNKARKTFGRVSGLLNVREKGGRGAG